MAHYLLIRARVQITRKEEHVVCTCTRARAKFELNFSSRSISFRNCRVFRLVVAAIEIAFRVVTSYQHYCISRFSQILNLDKKLNSLLTCKKKKKNKKRKETLSITQQFREETYPSDTLN